MSVNRRVGILAASIALLLASPAFAAAPAAVAGAAQDAESHAAHAEADPGMEQGRANGANKPASWTAFPTLKARVGGEGRDRRMVTVVPQNIVASSIGAYSNNAVDAKAVRQLPLDMAGAKLDKPESGGYHWLTAREEQGGKVRVASTVHFFSERGAQNPTAMFMQQKQELEIIPQPYPREHSRYRANEDWKFLVRFNGDPLVGQKVLLETMNGTKAEYVTDGAGIVTVRIPDDFEAEAPKKGPGAHDHGRRSSDFVLATEVVTGVKNYLTSFNASYGTDAFDQRNLAMGLGFTLLGMIGAVPLLRHRKPAKTEGARNTAAETIKEVA